jgi:hypothetical protein
MKPQAGFVLPVMIYLYYRRRLRRRSQAARVDGELKLALIGVLCFGLWALLGVPFSLDPVELIAFYKQSAWQYPVTSANAFNVWGAIGFDRHDASGGQVVALAGIPAMRLGMLAFLGGTAFVLWRTHRAIEDGTDEGAALTLAAASTSLLAFALLTRMHERYMFTALALLAPLVFERRLRLAYAALSLLFVVNLWYPYVLFNHEQHVEDLRVNPLFDWMYGADFARDTWQKKVWSLAVVAVILLVAARGLRWIGAPPIHRRRVTQEEPAARVG